MNKKGGAPGEEKSTLRSYAKYRILTDVVESCKRRARYDRDYFVLVMDGSATKVFSSSCKMWDVYRSGIF